MSGYGRRRAAGAAAAHLDDYLRIAQRALAEERAAAERVHSLFGAALDASLPTHA